MAEIVGVVASGVTLVGATITVADNLLDFIGQVRSAPDEISFLHNEVTDTRLILSNIKENASQDQWIQTRLTLPDDAGIYGDPENTSKAEHLVRRIKRILAQIDSTLRDVTKSKSFSGVTIHSRAWFLNRSKIRSLRMELRELKTTIAVHYSAGTGTLAGRTVVLLKRVLLENVTRDQSTRDRDNQVDNRLQTLAQKLTELTTMREAQRELMALIENLNRAVVTSEERTRETITTTTTTTVSHGISSGGSPFHTSSSQTYHLGREDSTRTSTTTTVSTESVSRLKLEFSRFQKRGCVHDCECRCHARQRYKSPSFAQKVLGELFIGFSSLPLLSKGCTDVRCKQRSPFSATLTYYLPSMLFKKMVSLICITTSQGDPAACLKIRPLNTDFSIHRAVETNNIGSVRSMIERCASLSSATFKGGWTPLHYAISYGHTAICRSLLAAGADPMIEDGTNQISPLEWAWTKILGGSYEYDTQREMEELFSDRDCLEEMGFTTLHRIVLGLNGSSLDTYLSQNSGCINVVDSTGRTALSWAAQRGMTDVVNKLLQSGADPNICTSNGHSALQYAASARNPGCIQPLINSDAIIDQADVEGQTSLHYAAVKQHDLAYYRPLIKAGADLDWRTNWHATPLATTVLEGHNEAMRYLVECGADINLKTHDGRPPVFNAVEYNNHEALQFLHEKGADLTGASVAWPTIAHIAAYCADIDTLRILTSFRLSLDDVECVDQAGFSITKIIDKRYADNLGLEDVFVEAFVLFLASITVSVRVDEDEFHDAVEVLPSH